jgi:hypothetical protein
MGHFVSFKSFYNYEDAADIIQLFRENNIEAIVVKAKPVVDKVIGGDGMDNEFFVKIRQSDFQKANELLDQKILENISSISSDYYLYSFSDSELMDIIRKPDEWSNQDYIIAHKILGDRGIAISDSQLTTMRSDRMKDLARPEKEATEWIILGYVFAFLLPILGCILGLSMKNAKRLLPDGNRVPLYTEKARRHFGTMAIISVIMFAFWLIAFLNGNARYSGGFEFFPSL